MNLNQYSVAAAQPGLAVERVLSLRVPIPPVDEQNAIFESIAQHTVQPDAAILSAGREIELVRAYRTRLISDVVTGKLNVRGVAPLTTEEPLVPEEMEEKLEDDALEDEEPDMDEGEENATDE